MLIGTRRRTMSFCAMVASMC